MLNGHRLCVSIFATLLLVLASMPMVRAADKPDATGTWKWTSQGRQGGDPIEWTLKLKQDGDKLTGSVNAFNTDTPISDGTIKDGEVSFSVVRERNDQKFVTTYKGKLDGDTIKGKSERERQGEKVSTDWEAKRVKEPA